MDRTTDEEALSQIQATNPKLILTMPARTESKKQSSAFLSNKWPNKPGKDFKEGNKDLRRFMAERNNKQRGTDVWIASQLAARPARRNGW